MTKVTQQSEAAEAALAAGVPMSDAAEGDAMSIETFCRRHGFSRAMYYIMRDKGRAPREIKVGTRVLISREAAAEWRRRMERDASKSAAR